MRRPEDADVINRNWEHKAATSLDVVSLHILKARPRCALRLQSVLLLCGQVRRMIDLQLCAGVRSVEDGRLVSWFLTYPDGSMGILFTDEVGA
jgi:hypothetical protein